MKKIVKRVWPQDDAFSLDVGRWALSVGRFLPSLEPRLEIFARKHRNLSWRRDTDQFLYQAARNRRAVHKVDEARRKLRELRPDVNQSERVSVNWTEPMFVVMREELGLVRRHIHMHRAIGLATFAGEAKIKRLLHVFVAPPAFHKFLVIQHFPEQSSATSRGMFFLAGHHVTRAHGPNLVPAARAYTDAALRRVRKTSVVVRIS